MRRELKRRGHRNLARTAAWASQHGDDGRGDMLAAMRVGMVLERVVMGRGFEAVEVVRGRW